MMRTVFCTEKPDEITFRLTLVATAKEFELLRDQLEDIKAHPCSELKYGLSDVLGQARKMFWARPTDND